jgi:hypothetical protein
MKDWQDVAPSSPEIPEARENRAGQHVFFLYCLYNISCNYGGPYVNIYIHGSADHEQQTC